MTSLLGQYHNETTATLRMQDEQGRNVNEVDDYDHASELAIQLITDAGMTWDTLDAAGEPVSDDVQTLLVLALVRAPMLVAHLTRLTEEN